MRAPTLSRTVTKHQFLDLRQDLDYNTTAAIQCTFKNNDKEIDFMQPDQK